MRGPSRRIASRGRPAQRREAVSLNQRVERDHAAQCTSITFPPPLVLVPTPQTRSLAQNAYFHVVDRRKIIAEY